ncbi:MAG: hypothetical protein A2048_01570 [Deltaproteobacteria bacterium GWA2_45_12]|nr:MAG: hypothetical protein A2048_01570 [Deltaproteobacteria bacterium GWA2_45_12]
MPGKLHDNAPYGKFALGGWAYTSRFDDVFDTDASGNAVRRDGNFGIYGFGEYTIYRERDPTQGLALFSRLGYANPDLNQINYYLGAGVTYTGLIPCRDKDRFGLALASIFNGEKFRKANAGNSVEKTEINLELTYRAVLAPWLALQPDFQFIINPGTEARLENAFLAGVRWELSL